jgi:hypothetical protein
MPFTSSIHSYQEYKRLSLIGYTRRSLGPAPLD